MVTVHLVPKENVVNKENAVNLVPLELLVRPEKEEVSVDQVKMDDQDPEDLLERLEPEENQVHRDLKDLQEDLDQEVYTFYGCEDGDL